MESLVLDLFAIEAVKFGDFKLKSGIQSPIYFDLRVLVSHPRVLEQVSEELWLAAEKGGASFATVCGVPYTALPMATLVSVRHGVPMVMKRREAKDHGTKKLIEGSIIEGSACLVIEDVVTSGGSVLETAQALTEAKLVVKDAVVFLDREQGGRERLFQKGIKLHSVLTVSHVLATLERLGKIDSMTSAQVRDFIRANTFSPVATPKVLSYEERVPLVENCLTKRLLRVMIEKRTNLVFSADLKSKEKLIEVIDSIGPYVCMVKTHIDIIENVTSEFVTCLTQLATKHNFLLFEDRKFCDIGNTVEYQYGHGTFEISQWADVINAHALPGPGIVEGLKKVGLLRGRGCLLIAEMSSKGNLISSAYTQESVAMAMAHRDFVIGFIAMRKLTDDPNFLHFTPGVHLASEGDTLGQQYLTPEEVIKNRRSDLIIVGRGIYEATDPVEAAKLYRKEAYKAYEESLK